MPNRDINDLKSHFMWRKTLMLPTLALVLLSQVIPLMPIPDPWSLLATIAAICSTLFLFAIALIDWFKGASESQALALLIDQVKSHDVRLNRVEGITMPSSHGDITVE